MSTILSPNHYSGRVRPIRVIVLHTMESPELYNTAEAVGNYFARPATKASSHVGIDIDTNCRYVADTDTAWATPYVNADGLQLEMAGRAGQSSSQWADVASKAILELSARQVAAWCRKWHIPPVRLTNAQLKAGGRGIIDHHQGTQVYGGSHTDVGTGFPWVPFLKRVNVLLDVKVVVPPIVAPKYILQDCKNMQAAVGVYPDGKWGSGTDRNALALYAALHANAFDVKLVQTIIGAKADGVFGPVSKAALVKKIVQLQTVLKVAKDGSWGLLSNRAFNAIRGQFLNK